MTRSRTAQENVLSEALSVSETLPWGQDTSQEKRPPKPPFPSSCSFSPGEGPSHLLSPNSLTQNCAFQKSEFHTNSEKKRMTAAEDRVTLTKMRSCCFSRSNPMARRSYPEKGHGKFCSGSKSSASALHAGGQP